MNQTRSDGKRLVREAYERKELTKQEKDNFVYLITKLPEEAEDVPQVFRDVLDDELLPLLHKIQAESQGPAGPLLISSDMEIADQIFQTFDWIPKLVDQVGLKQILQAPLAGTLPVTPSQMAYYQDHWPQLFAINNQLQACRLLSLLTAPWTYSFPSGKTSEMARVLYWDATGAILAEEIGRMLGIDVIVSRNTEDKSITIDQKKRDWLVHLDNVLLIAGEDKPYRFQLPMAERELRDKHKATNAALYGQLGYIILLANAGDRVKVFAKGLHATDPLVNLQEITISTALGKRQFLQLHINLVRWLRTVQEQELLPGIPPPAPIGQTFRRANPFLHEYIMLRWAIARVQDFLLHVHQSQQLYHQQVAISVKHGLDEFFPNCVALYKFCCAEGDWTEITIFFSHVVKAFAVPDWAVNHLLWVYRVLRGCNLAGVMTCTSFQVDGEEVLIGTEHLPTNIVRTRCSIKLELEPVGTPVLVKSAPQLAQLLSTVLAVLKVVHAAGLVHRDVRIENIIQVQQQYVLIDWELAGAANFDIFWRAKVMPRAVQDRLRPYQAVDDLWQVGIMARSQLACLDPHPLGVHLQAIASDLVAYRISDAGQALQRLAQL